MVVELLVDEDRELKVYYVTLLEIVKLAVIMLNTVVLLQCIFSEYISKEGTLAAVSALPTYRGCRRSLVSEEKIN